MPARRKGKDAGRDARATQNHGKNRSENHRRPFAAQGLQQNRKWSVLINAAAQIAANPSVTRNDDTKSDDGPHRSKGRFMWSPSAWIEHEFGEAMPMAVI